MNANIYTYHGSEVSIPFKDLWRIYYHQKEPNYKQVLEKILVFIVPHMKGDRSYTDLLEYLQTIDNMSHLDIYQLHYANQACLFMSQIFTGVVSSDDLAGLQTRIEFLIDNINHNQTDSEKDYEII